MGNLFSVSMGPRPSMGSPSTFIARPRTASPTGTEIGLAAESAWGQRGGVSVLMGKDGEREVRLGMAASLSSEFEIRLGWRRRVGTGSDETYGFAWQRGLVAGFGVSLGRFWVDYTYEDASPLDAIHRFALRADIRPQ